jgi:hypothetical protein
MMRPASVNARSASTVSRPITPDPTTSTWSSLTTSARSAAWTAQASGSTAPRGRREVVGHRVELAAVGHELAATSRLRRRRSSRSAARGRGGRRSRARSGPDGRAHSAHGDRPRGTHLRTGSTRPGCRAAGRRGRQQLADDLVAGRDREGHERREVRRGPARQHRQVRPADAGQTRTQAGPALAATRRRLGRHEPQRREATRTQRRGSASPSVRDATYRGSERCTWRARTSISDPRRHPVGPGSKVAGSRSEVAGSGIVGSVADLTQPSRTPT